MHELSLMENALEIALDWAKQRGATQIHRIQLGVGSLSGVVPEALEFAFEAMRKGTIAAEAQLEILAIPAVCYCSSCKQNFEPVGWLFDCPQCHQVSAEVLQGRELELTSLEVS